MRPPQIVIVGYGSTLRGDDALGIIVAERLGRDADGRQVVVRTQSQLTPELAESLANATMVVFLDAAVDGPEGQVNCRPLVEDSPDEFPGLHGFGPDQLLALTRRLFGSRPPAFLVSARGCCFDMADRQLSPTAASVVEPMVERVQRMIEQHMQSFGGT